MSDELATLVERVMVQGDLSKLSPAERTTYYLKTCESLGLNPLTRPFDYVLLQGKLVFYARRDATDQLRRLHRVSVRVLAREERGDLYCVTVQASTADGRQDEALGAVVIAGLRGVDLANAYMKAESKAKRRVTLSICGLGMLDETEVADLPPSVPQVVGPEAVASLAGSSADAAAAAPVSPANGTATAPTPITAWRVIGMVTELNSGTFSSGLLERYFGPGVKTKSALEALDAEAFRAGYAVLAADHAAGTVTR